jgi:hypothetical protein
MSGARLRLVIAAVLFVGWLAWLGYAVYHARFTPQPPVVVSRAQLTAATHLLVAEVSVGSDGLPAPTVKVLEVLRGDNVDRAQPAEVVNLPAAMPPDANGFPGAGTYLIPAVGDGHTFRVAGLPRSPGFDAVTPARPAIYLWNDTTRAQLKALEITP